MGIFFCSECGAESTKWSGKCPVCGAWNSLKETTRVTGKKKKKNIHGFNKYESLENVKPEPLRHIKVNSHTRILSKIGEFDGTLGGGIVPGVVALIGGEPGVGKSTLMLQIANKLAETGNKILYVSGEESKDQIKLRSVRLKCDSENLYLYCQTSMEEIIQTIYDFNPNLVVIDSIQSVYHSDIESSSGSVSQLRECTSLFTRIAKQQNIPFFLVGHVTKDGVVAGPKIIEHMVDTVLYFEGEVQNQYKILRATKNRFGSTNEIGIFEMLSNGLQEIENPSQLFLSKDERNPGTAVGCVLEGTRPFLVEVQALVSPANYGYSQRVALGFDQKKLALLLAVIEKNLFINLKQNDVFINLAGGMKVLEPALDLAVIAAIISSSKEKALPAETILLGEVGLNGEIRAVSQIEKRLKEAIKLGYKNIIVSGKNKNIKKNYQVKRIQHLRQLIPIVFK